MTSVPRGNRPPTRAAIAAPRTYRAKAPIPPPIKTITYLSKKPCLHPCGGLSGILYRPVSVRHTKAGKERPQKGTEMREFHFGLRFFCASLRRARGCRNVRTFRSAYFPSLHHRKEGNNAWFFLHRSIDRRFYSRNPRSETAPVFKLNYRPPELVGNRPIPKTMEEAGERRLAELRSVQASEPAGFFRLSFLIQKGFKLTQMAPGSRLQSEAQALGM